MCGWFHTRGTWGVGFFLGVLEVFLCHSTSCMQDFVPYTIIIDSKKKKKGTRTRMQR